MDKKTAMEYRESLKGKKILVVGLGKSGKAAVRALNELGADVEGQDAATADRLDTQFLSHTENQNIKLHLGVTPEDMSVYDMLVLSPGVAPDQDFIHEADAMGAEIIGELELAYRITVGQYIAITGTNGKTTTTTLVGEIFEAAGMKEAVVGNIGNPVVSEAMISTEGEWMVAEVSSFQLETTVNFRPVISAILNLTPDHLNRHGTMEAYAAAKAKVAENQTPDEYLVINYDDSECMKLADNTKAKVVPFSRTAQLESGAYIDEEYITVKDFDGTSHRICRTSELKIIGDHNVENALAAAAISYFAGIDPEIIGDAIRNFAGVEHRIEFCGNVDGIEFYNDSKGTNVDAAVIALKALEDNIILIAGGDGKAQDFTELAKNLKGRVKTLVLLGRDADQIEEAARAQGFTEIINCKDMPDCVRTAKSVADEGDKVLLSPACASWDMYSNYEQRGRHFKECVKELLK